MALRTAALAGAGAAWIAAAALGFGYLVRFSATPAELGRAPATWPASAALPRESGRATLLVLVHPRCPCSRATLRELERLLARTPAAVTATVIMVTPDEAEAGFDRTGLREIAEAIHGVRVVTDHGGLAARLFDASTSGQTLLYDAAGALRYSGGLTAARGHEGESLGRTALEGILAGDAGAAGSRVFGCELFDRGGAS